VLGTREMGALIADLVENAGSGAPREAARAVPKGVA
jgi:hypothetical protein